MDKDSKLLWEAYTLKEAGPEQPHHNSYPAHWPVSMRGRDQLAASKELDAMGQQEDPFYYNPLNPQNRMPYEGFWVNDDQFEIQGDPALDDGTILNVVRQGEWPDWTVTVAEPQS